jgi:hypothetical protein
MRAIIEPLLASNLLYITYDGRLGAATIAFDADGHTDNEGLLTLTDTAAHTFGCGDYANLGLLAAAISAQAGWKATIASGLTKTTAHTATGLGTARPCADTTATAIVPGVATAALNFANAYEIMAAGAETAVLTARAVPTWLSSSVGLIVELTGADDGASGNAEFRFIGNFRGDPCRAFDVDRPVAWDTVPLWDAVTAAINGATAVRATFGADCGAVPQLRLASVVNPDDAVLNIAGYVLVNHA